MPIQELPPQDVPTTAECPHAQHVLAWMRGQLPIAEAEVFRDHLTSCSWCQAEHAGWQQFDDLERSFALLDGEPPIVPGYRLLLLVGKGGCGSVWLAEDLEMGRVRALKFLRPDLFGDGNVAALRQEGNLIDDLGTHPHRVRIYRFLTTPEYPVLVMEYVDGGTLANQKPLPWDRACRYIAQAGSALLDAHAKGLCHGDITPRNILLRSEGDAAVLTDFGLANAAGEARGGSAGYGAPELLDGQGGPAADVFGLAATLFCLVTGHPPFSARTLLESCRQARAGCGDLIYPDDVPTEFQELVAEGLSPDPATRIGLAEFHRRCRVLPNGWLASKLQEAVCELSAPTQLDVVATLIEPTRNEVRQRVHAAAGRETAVPFAQVAGHTGDALVLEVKASRAGFFTLLCLDSSGELRLLPVSGKAGSASMTTHQTLELSGPLLEPAGSDCFVAVWTALPLQHAAGNWRSWLCSVCDTSQGIKGPARGFETVLQRTTQSLSEQALVVLTVQHEVQL